VRPELLLIDGNRFKPYWGIPHQCIVKGDSLFRSIAAASILAKTHRDECMMQLDSLHPEYGWKENKGYPTLQHKKAIAAMGVTPHHRLTFKMSIT
jgi:ribonuclease HII